MTCASVLLMEPLGSQCQSKLTGSVNNKAHSDRCTDGRASSTGVLETYAGTPLRRSAKAENLGNLDAEGRTMIQECDRGPKRAIGEGVLFYNLLLSSNCFIHAIARGIGHVQGESVSPPTCVGRLKGPTSCAMEGALVRDYGQHLTHCAYCGKNDASSAHGMTAEDMSVQTYNALLDRLSCGVVGGDGDRQPRGAL